MKYKFLQIFFIVILPVLSGCNQQRTILTREIQFKSEQEDCIKAMTFNIRTGHAWWLDGWTFNHWGARRNPVIETIAENAADVIAMQEVVSYQLKEIQKALPQYSKYAKGRINGKKQGRNMRDFI